MMTPVNNSDALYYNWNTSDSLSKFHVYLHFAELELLGPDVVSEFTVCCGDSCRGEPVRPEYLVTTTIQTPQPLSGQDDYSCSIKKTPRSTLPPILNAIEIFTISQLTEKPTREWEVEAMFDIRETYKVERNWMGDPCVPKIYFWDGLTCKYTLSDAPTIISLNLSSTRLKGEIAASLANLTSIQSFVDNNPDLCVSDSCDRDSNKQKIIILIVASVASIVILLIIVRRFKWRKQDLGSGLRNLNKEIVASVVTAADQVGTSPLCSCIPFENYDFE
ncbi:hypothetical protein MRB53_012844 [Persea americana]|uniref:Uncharacterized protein n=1 Tax=Persea americana TaxID=3435 RepID=A0ACC2LYM0_PERAE|nr:hypothetical protein MRB53_012844 [Persea americana]